MDRQRVVSQDETIDDDHHGTVIVERGRLTLSGAVHGTLGIQPNAAADISGSQHGTVSVGAGATVTVSGAIHGTTSVSRGATLVIEPTGTLAGTLSNDGLVIVRGVFGGVRTGHGEFRLEGDGYVKEPYKSEGGVSYYKW